MKHFAGKFWENLVLPAVTSPALYTVEAGCRQAGLRNCLLFFWLELCSLFLYMKRSSIVLLNIFKAFIKFAMKKKKSRIFFLLLVTYAQ